VILPIVAGAICLGLGFVVSSMAANLWQFALAQGLIGLGSSGSFGPIMSDISHWFARRRGIAVALASCGNYLSGVIWPPLVQHLVAANGWRPTQIAVGITCVVLMLPLSLAMRRRAPAHAAGHGGAAAAGQLSSLGVSANTLMVLLS